MRRIIRLSVDLTRSPVRGRPLLFDIRIHAADVRNCPKMSDLKNRISPKRTPGRELEFSPRKTSDIGLKTCPRMSPNVSTAKTHFGEVSAAQAVANSADASMGHSRAALRPRFSAARLRRRGYEAPGIVGAVGGPR